VKPQLSLTCELCDIDSALRQSEPTSNFSGDNGFPRTRITNNDKPGMFQDLFQIRLVFSNDSEIRNLIDTDFAKFRFKLKLPLNENAFITGQLLSDLFKILPDNVHGHCSIPPE
jgi:hypothetical protein